MLWIDDAHLTSFEQLSLHSQVNETLGSLAPHLPHLILSGQSGTLSDPGVGKKTRVACLLTSLYGSVTRAPSTRVFGATTRQVTLDLITSVHHLECTPSQVGRLDSLVITVLHINTGPHQGNGVHRVHQPALQAGRAAPG